MICVYYADIPDKARDYTADGFPPAFPDVWREYVRSIKDDNRRRQSFFVRVLLLYALKKNGIKAAAFSEKDGRWNISSPLTPVDFSLSHSGNTVVAAINPNGKTGADGEYIVTVAAEDESAANGAEFVRIKDLEKCIPYI